MSESFGSLGAGLVLEDRFAIHWREQPIPVHDPVQQQTNDETLRVILSLDEHHGPVGEDNAELSQELVRIESRLNLVLDLVSQVLIRQLALPPARAVRLGSREIEWEEHLPLPPGSEGSIEIYLCTRYPRPLLLPARFVESPSPGVARAVFGPLGESVQELLEQMIFRHHRRRIAATRRSSNT